MLVACSGVGSMQNGYETKGNVEYLRIHIRANSNDEFDQSVKYLVRDKIVDYLTPVVATCETKTKAKTEISYRIDELSEIATDVLRENGYNYSGKAYLRKENFPTRVYENLTLQAGVYDAIVVELGSGKGDNWWCVVYPPLCFSGGKVTAGNIRYKSKIAEIVERFWAKWRIQVRVLEKRTG